MPFVPDATRAATTGLAPELAMLAAVMQQAVHDVRSRRPDIRQDALQFLRDTEAVAWWGNSWAPKPRC